MTKTTKTVYVTSDKQEFGSEAEAQAHEIDELLPVKLDCTIGQSVVANKDAILSILGAKRKARSDKGKSRNRNRQSTNAGIGTSGIQMGN